MKQLIYIDESSFNLWTHSRNGWNPKDERLNCVVSNSNGYDISIVLALGKKGPIHFRLRTGSYHKDTYQEFIDELGENLDPHKNFCIIQENDLI